MIALGFGASGAAAVETAQRSLERGFDAVNAEYVTGWKEYAHTLRRVDARYERLFQLSAMVLKAHEDKTYRGAMIASMSIPWGFSVKASEPTVGGYHLVWARDLYEVATGLLAAGDRAAAERALNYLLTVQEKPDGSYPQNSWLDGKPYWTALQMDEIAYPLVLATWAHRCRDLDKTHSARSGVCGGAWTGDRVGTLGRGGRVFAGNDRRGNCRARMCVGHRAEKWG